MTCTLRGRLTLWYITSVGLIVLLFLAALSVLFWVTLENQIDHHVHIAVNEAKEIVQNYHGGARDSLIKNLVSARGMTVVVLSPDGSALLETNSSDVALVTEHQLQKILMANNLNNTAPTHFTENNIRFAAMTVQVNAGKGIVAVGYSTQVLYETLYRMFGIVIAVILFIVVPISFFGYNYLRKQLKPLESISKQAKAVTNTSSLFKRITLKSSTVELKTIQEALNIMLSKLENIFTGEHEFFSDAAHTLKTPLAILRSQIENINITKKAQKDMLLIIDKANETLQDLLFLSMLYSKPQKTEKISLTDIMNNLSELATTLGADKNLNISSTIAANVRIMANKKLLQRALSNIVHNAVIYNKHSGTINLKLNQRSSLIKIIIKDTGIGIPKKDIPYVFNRFFRGSNAINKNGSGLGLAITKAIIESYGGKILFISHLSKGTKTIVTLYT